MTMLVPNCAESLALQFFVNKTAPTNLVLRLYKTNVTPAESDTAGSYTEATFTGYAAATLTGASWGAVSEGTPSTISYAAQTFTSSANQALQTIYGAYMTWATSGTLAGAELFSASIPIQNNGDAVVVTPTITAE